MLIDTIVELVALMLDLLQRIAAFSVIGSVLVALSAIWWPPFRGLLPFVAVGGIASLVIYGCVWFLSEAPETGET